MRIGDACNCTPPCRERDELDSRLDALDTRVGDTSSGGGATAGPGNRTRLSNIERASGSSGLTRSAQTQARVETGDLIRLDDAYARSAPSSEERSALERRIADLEMRVGVRR